MVIEVTKRPFDLDDAVLGRLPRRLLIDLPDEEWKEVLKILSKGEKIAEDVRLDEMAKSTRDFSGSNLKHLHVSAPLDAVKAGLEEPQNANRRRYLCYSMSAVRASGEAGTCVLTTDNDRDASNAPRAPTGAKSASSKTECLPNIPFRVIRPSNVEEALKKSEPKSMNRLGELEK